jgi:hypothetical protein
MDTHLWQRILRNDSQRTNYSLPVRSFPAGINVTVGLKLAPLWSSITNRGSTPNQPRR